jgi:hypothetical protein
MLVRRIEPEHQPAGFDLAGDLFLSTVMHFQRRTTRRKPGNDLVKQLAYAFFY